MTVDDLAGADDAQPAVEAPGDFIAEFNSLIQHAGQ